jgi:hypothetical protein
MGCYPIKSTAFELVMDEEDSEKKDPHSKFKNI